MKEIIKLSGSMLFTLVFSYNLSAQDYTGSEPDKLTFIDGVEVRYSVFMEACIDGFGSDKAMGICDCLIRDISSKVTSKTFLTDGMNALFESAGRNALIEKNKSQQAMNLALVEYMMSSVQKCIETYPEVLNLPFFKREHSDQEIEAMAEFHLIQLKKELGLTEYNSLSEMVDMENYSKCFIIRLLDEFTFYELTNLTKNQELKAEEIQISCMAIFLKSE